MNKNDFEKKLTKLPAAEPDAIDKKAIQRITRSEETTAISLDVLKEEMDFSGKISLRVPKTLHRDLVFGAKKEGVSLNQYLLYKLSH
ncbi:MAG: type II toxin-antitoxin system HicB family antitoxin [Oscillospiraceae bacterium]|jgi:hypothetical protein|nr:type II toxin-antitoxin system HicB family antitoxin [Oscillospiraceae bacterium]